jgi:hypothetical protein
VPNIELYGGFVLNLPSGGINPAGVEFMATQIRGEPGRIVWMPAGDTEKERQGVQHMIATHAFDLSGKMTVEQMQEAAKLGAFIEFDFRNTLENGRTDAIRKVGPQYSFISEFWTKLSTPRVYGGAEGVGAFAEAMRARGFADRELEVMFKENPAKALGLKAIP